ncbi:MAG: GNAT family N-acetyltransferase [Armatimonadota bacterium]
MSDALARHSDSDRATPDLAAWDGDTERDCGFETGTLSQRGISYLGRDKNQAIWTKDGGAVMCEDEALAASIVSVIDEHSGDDYAALVGRLETVIGERVPGVSCRIDMGMYCREPRADVPGELSATVEIRCRGAAGVPDLPESVEHVFLIRDGPKIASWASNIPVLQVGDHWLHSVGVGTDPGYRRRGYGKAVVTALAKHVADEGGATMWVCEANNVASFRLARSIGYIEHDWVLNWKAPG